MTDPFHARATTARSISVIVPAYRAAHLLPDVLAPLLAMQRAGDVAEVLVIDDCSPDDTAEIARNLGARVLTTSQNGGPGAARNLAATSAVGDILWFVDSDVIAKESGAEIILKAFDEPGVMAVFGSYDDAPAGTPWFSRYKNLTHRFYHKRAKREAQTFWAGCGAVDRALFLELGGFAVEEYPFPSIEDIELGYRIRRAGGRILLLNELEAKHLKVWTVRNAVFTDIFRRALPWSRLMVSREGLTDDLNTSWGERLKALVALAFLAQPLVLVFAPYMWPAAVGLILLALVLNWSFARYLVQNGGLGLALGGMLYHQVYYVYSASVFVWCLFEYHVLPNRDRQRVR